MICNTHVRPTYSRRASLRQLDLPQLPGQGREQDSGLTPGPDQRFWLGRDWAQGLGRGGQRRERCTHYDDDMNIA